MSTLSQYILDTRDFVNDPNSLFWNDYQMKRYVNRARTRVANDAQCIRVLLPGTGSIATATPASPGSGYTTSPTVTISAPDGPYGGVQAIVTANAPVAGAITGYTIVNAGTGYVAPPVVTVSGGGGAGALPALTLTAMVRSTPGQEVYTFASMTPALKVAEPSAKEIISLQSLAVSWGSVKPVMYYQPWTTFQAQYRAYNIGFENYGQVWSQYGRGAAGKAYLWPIPATYYSMDWDAYCTPIDLQDDTTIDLVPEPFTSCVPYYAAHLAFMNSQRKDDAAYYLQLYKERLIECGVYTTPSYAPSAYEDNWQ